MSYLCHYTNLCPHKPHKHAHTHTHTQATVWLHIHFKILLLWSTEEEKTTGLEQLKGE